MKKIIGYKLNELGKENLAAIAAIVDYKVSSLKKILKWNSDDYGWNIKHESTMRLELEKAGVLSIWCTPVYGREAGYVPNDLGWKNIKACAVIIDETEESIIKVWRANISIFGRAFANSSSHAKNLREAKVLDIWFDKVGE